HALTLLDDVQVKLASVSLSDLPVSAKQKAQFTKLISELPTIHKGLSLANELLGTAGWLLGVGQPRNFLIQTLDRAELRPTGGFTGNYGVLTIHNGKVDPFELFNVNDIEYGYQQKGWICGKRPPREYSWWAFANWGLRDSNLSPDFPTSAKMIADIFQHETGQQVDGVIQFSPVVIAHVLKVTGPLDV